MDNETSLINLNGLETNPPKLVLNSKFKAILNEMNELTKDYHKLVDNVNLDDLTEDQIDDLSKKLQPMQKYYKDITSAKKDMRRLFNHQRDVMTTQLDEILAQNGMDQLTEMDATKKQLRRDLLNHRISRRWAELKSTFDDNFTLYPNLVKYAAPLMDYGNFRIQHADLVSGAKNADITDNQRGQINHIIAEWNQDLQSMIDNTNQLPNEYRKPLLTDWLTNPSHDNYIRLSQYYKLQATTKAKQHDNALTIEPKNQSVTALNVNGEFDWLLDDAFAHSNTHDITTDKAKASMILRLCMGMTDKSSVFYKHIGPNYEMMLRAITYILNR